MQCVYRNRVLKLRFWSALVVFLAVAALVWRLSRVSASAAGSSETSLLLYGALGAPLLFTGMGLAWIVSFSWRTVGCFEADLENRIFRLHLWRPVGWRCIAGRLSDITGWRYVSTGRGRTFRAQVARTDVRFEIRRHRDIEGAWRAIAPGAVAAYERDTGLRVRE